MFSRRFSVDIMRTMTRDTVSTTINKKYICFENTIKKKHMIIVLLKTSFVRLVTEK